MKAAHPWTTFRLAMKAATVKLSLVAMLATAGRADDSAPVFMVSPVDPADVTAIIPLGNLNPRGGHVLPTDHVYFEYQRKPGPIVVAPAAGTVFAIRDQFSGGLKIEVRVNDNLSYYLAHLFLDSDVRIGSRVQAGQVLGRASGGGALDLGASDARVKLRGLINPARYPRSTLQTVSPLAWFTESLKRRLYPKVIREGDDKDGKIDLDQAGRLVGNWFHASLTVDENSRAGREISAKELAFAYDVRRPKEVRISIGGTIAPAGLYAVQPGAHDPATVTVQAGLIKYQLLDPGGGDSTRPAADSESLKARGVLLVQLLGERKLNVEYFPSPAVDTVAGFTSQASVYER